MNEQDWLSSTDPTAMLRYVTGTEDGERGNGHRLVSARKLRLFACACCRQVWHLLTDDATCGRCNGKGSYHSSITRDSRIDHPCADCSGIGRINRSRRAVETAERYADGEATEEERQQASCAALRATEGSPTNAVVAWASLGDTPQGAAQHAVNIVAGKPALAAILRCIVGNPYKPVRLTTVLVGGNMGLPHARPPWLTPTVLRIAATIYAEQRWDETGVLADALEDAGCSDADLLAHLRGKPYRMRCWKCKGSGKMERTVRDLERVDEGFKTKSGKGPCDEVMIYDRDGTGRRLQTCREGWFEFQTGPHVRGCHVVDAILGKE